MRKTKKSYNPFKMWGSYVGLMFGFVGAYFSFAIIYALAEQGKFHPIHLMIFAIPIILGFLIGWGIHSLIRSKFDN